jgi:hypothetical protein
VAGTVSTVPILAVLGVQKVVVHLSLRGGESRPPDPRTPWPRPPCGVSAPQLCIIDGSKGLRRAVEHTWPQAAIQRGTVHKLRNLLTAAPKRLHEALRTDYHAIVLAEDGAMARRAYTTFVIRDSNHPQHTEMLDWVGGRFDPDAFTPDAVNRALRRVR